MTKAEERALEKYPIKEEWIGNQYGGIGDVNKLSRIKFREGYELAQKDLGWVSVKERLPEETKESSDTMQGHREWTESKLVYVAFSDGTVGIDSLRNGKFRRDGYKDCDGFPNWIEYWMPIPELPTK